MAGTGPASPSSLSRSPFGDMQTVAEIPSKAAKVSTIAAGTAGLASKLPLPATSPAFGPALKISRHAVAGSCGRISCANHIIFELRLVNRPERGQSLDWAVV